jgi:hypothetical protein
MLEMGAIKEGVTMFFSRWPVHKVKNWSEEFLRDGRVLVRVCGGSFSRLAIMVVELD